MQKNSNEQKKIALITGASRGIGYEIALGLASQNIHIIALARTHGGLEQLDDEIKKQGGSATLVPLDICDFAALDKLAATINERWGKLDILIGNAAMLGDITPLSQMSLAMFEKIFKTNVSANYYLLKTLEPLLKKAKYARGLFITSGAVRSHKAFTAPYSASKAALEVMVKCYVDEIKNTNIKINLFDPSVVRTNMRASFAPGEDPQTILHPKALVPNIVNLCQKQTAKNGEIFDFSSQKWRK